MSIYLYKNNQQHGPYDESVVQGWLQIGTCSPNDLAVREGMTEWQPLGRILGFQWRTTDNNLKELMKEPMSKLSKANQQAINSFNWLKKCQEIGEKYNLAENEIYLLKSQVASVLLDSDYHSLSSFAEYGIGGNELADLRHEILDNVFKPILEIRKIITNFGAY